MSNSLVSIIMPAYNAEKYIREAIQSVIDQTAKNWELLVINDGSTDNTAAIVSNYVKQDARIFLISQENKKLGAARNTGITAARGDWMAFLDADDLWTAEKLEKQLAVTTQHPSADVLFSKGYIFSDNIERCDEYPTISGGFDARQMYKLEYEGNYIPVLSVLVKTALITKIGLQDENRYIHGCEDWDYWLRLAKNGAAFFGMDEYLFYYRRHATNMSNNNDMMRLAKATAFTKNLVKEWLTDDELEKVTSFVNITICSFIRKGKIKEALFLNRQLNSTLKENFRFFCSYLINAFGTRSYYPVRMIYKIGSILPAKE